MNDGKPMKDEGEYKLPNVDRLEVIDHRTLGPGRILSLRPVSVELSLQDDGRTLKVFIMDEEWRKRWQAYE